MPNLETRLWGFTLSWNVLIPGVMLLGIFYTLLALYPFIERWITGDQREHHVLDRPRNQPTRTAIGVAGITGYGILWLAGANDVEAFFFHLSSADITMAFRVLVFVAPVVAYLVTKRICLGLQRRDREAVLHGKESGIIRRLPSGEMIEVHTPLDAEEAYVLTQHEEHRPLPPLPTTDANGVAAPRSLGARLRVRLSHWYFGAHVPKPTREEIEAAWAHGGGHGDGEIGAGGHEEITAGQEPVGAGGHAVPRKDPPLP
jgi:ubiquinol-cytochrome c reductase cytochrome b subunit